MNSISTGLTRLPVNYEKLSSKKRRFVREQYEIVQGGRCWYCGRTLSQPPAPYVILKTVNESLFPQGFFNNKVHLHHDHRTGMTLGAVHARCNAVLWQYEKQ